MVCSLSLLSITTKFVHANVSLPNGHLAEITHVGLVIISFDLIAHNGLYVPFFTFNLISVTKPTSISSHIAMLFLSNKFLIQDLCASKIIVVANQKDSLYLL